MAKETRLFVSYRRRDGRRAASEIALALKSRMPGAEVFLDLSKIQKGEDWRSRIDHELLYADAGVAIISPSWARTFADNSNIEDIVTKEIAHFLRLERAIVPVLVDGASMPRAKDLPREIRSLHTTQAFSVARATYDEDLDQLADHLQTSSKVSGDHYNNALLGKRPPDKPRPRPFYYGEWNTVVKLPNGGGFTLRFEIDTGSMDIKGTYAPGGGDRPTPFVGRYFLIADPVREPVEVTGIHIEGTVQGLGPLWMDVPLDSKVAGVYTGTNDDGWHIWTTID